MFITYGDLLASMRHWYASQWVVCVFTDQKEEAQPILALRLN